MRTIDTPVRAVAAVSSDRPSVGGRVCPGDPVSVPTVPVGLELGASLGVAVGVPLG